MHTRWTRGSSDVVHEPQARVVGVVHVVDREQQTVRGRREAHELAGCDEQTLVRAAAGPRHLRAGERPIDLLPMVIGEAVEQGRVPATHVGQRLDDRRVRATLPRPVPTCRGRRGSSTSRARPTMASSSADLPTPAGPLTISVRLRPAAASRSGALGDRDLLVAADQGLVATEPRPRARRGGGRAGRSPRGRARRRAHGAMCDPCVRTGAARRAGRRWPRAGA